MFEFRHINRLIYPQKHILICEDDLSFQIVILNHLLSVFEPQGIVQFTTVPGSLAAATIINNCRIDLIILDHDMPQGNGPDLINWMKQNNKNIPIITSSGIDSNNINLLNHAIGFNIYPFNKNDIVSGQTDKLIKKIINVNNDNIAEFYTNTISRDSVKTARYWVAPNLLIGGNICNQDDWEHLKNDFNIKSVINVDGDLSNGHSDKNKNIDNLLEYYVPDNGQPFPANCIKEIIAFAKKHISEPIYLHCHMGISRSPHFAYAILRGCLNMSKKEALSKIYESLPMSHIGFNNHTINYIKSIEDVLNE